MKKKVLFCALTVLIFAALAMAELIVVKNRDPNPDFGFVPEVYTYPQKISVTDCTGDTDILRIEAYSPPINHDIRKLAIWFESTRPIMLTKAEFKDGKPTSNGFVGRNNRDTGTIEKYVDGEWVEYGILEDGRVLELSGGNLTVWSENGGDEMMYDFCFPASEHGTYRVTFFFRECRISDEQVFYTVLGSEVHSVSHTVTIPEPTEKPFDVVTLTTLPVSLYQEKDIWSCQVGIGIRFNKGGSLYIDRSHGTLEKFDNGRWTEAPIPEGENYTVYLCSEDNEWRFAGSADLLPGEMENYYMRFTFDDPDAEYRLKLEFAENADGTGEKYTLTLRIKFAEEVFSWQEKFSRGPRYS